MALANRIGSGRVIPQVAEKLPVNPETNLPESRGIVQPNQIEPPRPVPSQAREFTPPPQPQGLDVSTTAEEATQEGIREYTKNNRDIPLHEDQSGFGIVKDQTLDEATGKTGLGGRQGYHQVYNPETGQMEEVPMEQSEFQTQQQYEYGQNPNYSPESLDFTTGGGLMQQRLQKIAESQRQAGLLRQMETDKAKYNNIIEDAEADVAAWQPSVEAHVGRLQDVLTNGAFKYDFENVMAMPDSAITPENRGTITSLMALSELDAISRGHREQQEKDPADEDAGTQVVDHDNNVVPDGQYLDAAVDSIDSSLASALHKANIQMPADQRRQLAGITLAQSLAAQRFQEMPGKDGKTILVPTERMFKQAKDLKGLLSGITGGYSRMAPSRTKQIAGGTLTGGGPQVVKGARTTVSQAKKAGQVVMDSSNAAKDMLGSIAERTNPTSLAVWSKMAMDLVTPENMSEFDSYSNSPYADLFKVGKKAFDSTKQGYQPPRDMAPHLTPEKLDELATKHAEQVIRDKLEGLLGSDIFKARPEDVARYAGNPIQGSLQHAQNTMLPTGTPGGFYTPYTHSVINGRFYRDAAMTDINADKSGVRNTLGFTAQEGVQSSMINPNKDGNQVAAIKAKFNNLRGHIGVGFSQKLDAALTPNEQQALGLMIMLSKDRKAAANPAWNRASLFDLAEAYDAQDFNEAAGKGAKIQAWLDADPQVDPVAYQKAKEEADAIILDDKGGLERGEFQDKTNLWLDAYNLSAGTNAFYQPGTLATMDGTQNGVFLTGLYTGSDRNLLALGKYNNVERVNGELTPTTKLEDIRGFLYNNLAVTIPNSVSDPEAAKIWTNLFKDLAKIEGEGGRKKLLDDLTKAPIMQYSYGKNAGMFGKEMNAFLSKRVSGSSNKMIQSFHQELLDHYKTPEAMTKDLARIMEGGLKNAMDNRFTEMNKAYGTAFTLLNRVPNLKDVTGDSIILGKNTLGAVRTNKINEDVMQYVDDTGQTVNVPVQQREIAQQTYGDLIRLDQYKRSNEAGFAKDEKHFWNPDTKKYDNFTPEVGSGMANQMGVVMVQATDAALLKLMLLDVNKNRSVPLPVRTIHDSLVMTPRSLLHYANAYNNVAIPQAKNSIKNYAKNVDSEFQRQKMAVHKEMDERAARGERIGIGTDGEFSQIGSYFDSIHAKFFGPGSDSYRQVFIKGQTPEAIAKGELQFLKAQDAAAEFLGNAKHFGWVPPFGKIRPTEHSKLEDLDPMIKQYATVTPEQFKKLFDLAEEKLFKGKKDKWVREFELNVEDGYSALKNATRKTGIGQMSF